MISYQNCGRCGHFDVDDQGMRCLFDGICVYRTSRPRLTPKRGMRMETTMGMRGATPEDFRDVEVRDA